MKKSTLGSQTVSQMTFKPGELVTIKVKNPIWPMRKAYASYVQIPEYNTYTGRVVLDHGAIRTGQIGLTNDDPEFNLRVIDIERIVGLNDEEITVADSKSTSESWTVQGSKNKNYVVTLDHGRYECTCPGFQFRRACKHVDAIKEKLN